VIIAHDPGHGAPPAIQGVCANGIVERDAVLHIATDVAAGIPYVDHRLLRTGPVGVLDADRAKAAKALGAGLVVCHHINEDADKTSHGLITFYAPGDAIGEEVANVMADNSPARMVRTAGFRTYGASMSDWTSRALWVIGHYRAVGIPCVLIEWGFASNPIDAAFLLNPGNRPAMIACVAAGIARFMERMNVYQ
jgi:N-acetylmuramoyl-L-alanine amidase